MYNVIRYGLRLVITDKTIPFCMCEHNTSSVQNSLRIVILGVKDVMVKRQVVKMALCYVEALTKQSGISFSSNDCFNAVCSHPEI